MVTPDVALLEQRQQPAHAVIVEVAKTPQKQPATPPRQVEEEKPEDVVVEQSPIRSPSPIAEPSTPVADAAENHQDLSEEEEEEQKVEVVDKVENQMSRGSD